MTIELPQHQPITETKEAFSIVKQYLESRDFSGLNAYVEEVLYAQDLAELFELLQLSEMMEIFEHIDKKMAVDVLSELDEDLREKLIANYSPQKLAHDFVDYMDSDDAVDMLNQLNIEMRDSIIANMKDHEASRNIVSLLSYDETTAGGLMAKEVIKVNLHWTVAQCTDEIRKQAENVEKVYTTYVVDEEGVLVGIVSLKSIILSKEDTLVQSIYSDEIIWVSTHTKGEEVAQIMRKYDLVAIPVVDSLNRLIGRITFDDVVDFIKEEADRDYQLLSGLSEDVEISDRVWILSRARLPWLLIGLLGGIANSRFIGSYEGQLALFPQMAFYMPLVAAMGGNAGVQSSAIVVQGLANNTLGTRNILPKLGKEFAVALLNGLICSIILLSYSFIINSPQNLSYTVSIALVSAILFASLFGMLIPLLLDKFKIDPALATGPFITTSNDLLALGLYFAIGSIMM